MTRHDSILRNTIFSLIARGIDISVTFALAIVLARYLGPEGMGKYTYIIAFVAIFVPLVDLGLDHILIREIARHKETAQKYVGAAFLLKLLIVLVLLPLGMVVAWLIGDASVDNWAIFFCFAGTLILREIPTVVGYAVFLAYERMEFRAVVTLFFQIVKFAATLIAVLMGGGLISIFAAALLAEAAQGGVALYLVLRKFVLPRLVIDLKLWKYYVLESLPLGIAFGFNSLYFQVDIIILKYFRGDEETGLFGVPFRIVTTLFTLLIPMIWVLLPHLTRAAKDSIQRLNEEGQGYLKGIAVVTTGIALFLGMEGRDLVINLFGIEYEPSAIVLMAISPVIVFHAFSYFFDLTMTAVGKQRLIIVGAVSIFAVKLIVDLVCVPAYGIMGAALGTMASDLACFSVMFYLTRKHVTTFYFVRIMLRPAAAAIIAGIFLWVIRPLPFYLTFFLFGIVFVILVWVLKVVSPDQQQIFKEMGRGVMKKFGLATEDSHSSAGMG